MSHGRYSVLRKIADGGMAEIFLARLEGRQGFQKQVVLKRVRTALFADPMFRNTLLDEAHVAMDLNHGNIVQVLDLGEAGGRYFLALELVDGWSLEQLQKRAAAAQVPFPRALALYAVAQVCRALAYAHARQRDGKPLGIVHRDVSPQNILVSEQGEVKLTDFGIAKVHARADHTASGVVKGKVHFMSPEQADAAPLDGRSDLFSLGAVLYQLVSGKLPFAAPTPLETMLKVRAADFIPLTRACPDVEPELGRLVLKALQRKPEDRHQTAEEMLEDVEQVMRSLRHVGQTELARWLAELARKDGAKPISRADPDKTLHSDAVGGTIEISNSAIIPPTLPPMRRGSLLADVLPASELRPAPSALSPLKPPRPPRPPKGLPWGWFALFILGGAGVGYWLQHRDAEPEPVATAPQPTRPEARAPEPQAVSLPPVAPDAALSAEEWRPFPDAGAELAVAVDDSGEREEPPEEDLLKGAVSDPTEVVIGHEEGDAGPPARAEPVAAAEKHATKPAPAPAPAPLEQNSVKIGSNPKGAVVKIGSRVFGRTPIPLRFLPGITYELVLVKDGYAPAVRRIFVTGKKDQRYYFALQKTRRR